MADKPFIVVSEEEVAPARVAGQGRARDTYFDDIGLVDAIRDNLDNPNLVGVMRDSQGDIPTDETDASKKRRQSAQTKLRRAIELSPWYDKDKMRPKFRTRRYQDMDAVLFVGVRSMSRDELEKRRQAANKRAKTRAGA